ncbi:Guanine nucleotide exchange protein smcr8 [Desmophyllum pertusum]|uniref:Guanine nucleotide exchange protein smcr8 n=1 Tax=Desmophyllum pertusum TaxID=174260 RepID=A0A9X0AA55_9CNID|nr:Guanine nucleotide exchange protein smcr8 [Desmophyllum pertusum]
MHGAYDLSLTRTNEGQDITADEINLDKLAYNLRFSSDKVPRSNPWSRSIFNGDFILIAEFAENEGPKPVMTIPKNGGGNFDINAFAVHVMSVDYTQARGSNFSIVEDTQLFLTERKDGIYAYVHHFTLYDIHARGFVRPFCMCYISQCKRKMFSFLDSLMDEFTKVSRLFRHGNRITFIRDLEQRLTDVFAMKGPSISLENSHLDGLIAPKWKVQDMEKSIRKENEEYERILQETKKLIEVLKPHMVNDPRIVQQFRRLEDMAEGRSRSYTDADSCPLIKQGTSDHKLPSFVKQPSLRRAFSLPDMKDLLKGNKEVPVKPRSCLPSYLNGIKQLRHLHDLCEWGAKEGLNRLRNILKHYSRETAALLIEQTETSHLERFPSLLTIGRSVVCNVLRNIDMKCMSDHWNNSSSSNPPSQECLTRKSSFGSLGSLYSLESFQSCVEDEFVLGSSRSSDGILSPFAPSCSFHADLQGGTERMETLSCSSSDSPRTENSDVMSTHSDTTLTAARLKLSLADYAFMDEDALSDYNGSRFNRQTSAAYETNVSTHYTQFRGKSLSLESLSLASSGYASSRYHHKHHRRKVDYPLLQNKIPSPLTSSKPERIPNINALDVPNRNTRSTVVRHLYKRAKSIEGSGSSSPSVEDKLLQRRLLYNLRPEKIRLRCFAEEVSQPLETYTGSNVLLLRNNLSCGVHLLYALLCGRPVVVLAEPGNERDVRIVISALWMFVPENMSHGKAVDPWRTKPLQIADLAWLKLAGLAKNKHFNMVPKSVKRFVSVLDFEKISLFLPFPTIAAVDVVGHYLRSLCNCVNQWPSNAALVAFVHSVFLELANKAYVYYYAYCLGGLQWCCCKSNQRSDPGVAVEIHGDGSEILSRLGVHFSDAKIVQYFTELIKQQQIDYYQSLSVDHDFFGEGALTPDSDSVPERRSLLISTDLSKCAVFRNVKPLDFT